MGRENRIADSFLRSSFRPNESEKLRPVRPMSLVTAPLGVKAEHAMSRRTLEAAFACDLFIVGSRFVMSLAGAQ